MARPPFVFEVVALRRHPGYREHIAAAGPLDGLAVTGAAVTSPVALDGTLEAVEGGIIAAGVVSAAWAGECRRCLGPVEGTVEASVHELFVAEPEEGEAYPIEGDRINLEPLAREAVVLALPLAPLCSASCLGLCPTCGADLNAGPCECTPAAGDPRWSALDALRSEP